MVVLLSRTELDLRTLSDVLKEQLLKNIELNDVKDYLTFINKLKLPDVSKQLTLEDPGHVLKHISYTFLIVCNSDVILELVRTSNLVVDFTKTVQDDKLAIVTGNLQNWKDVIINDVECLRPVLNKVMILLELEGFDKLWLGYRKKLTDDNTFKLVRQRD